MHDDMKLLHMKWPLDIIDLASNDYEKPKYF